MEPYYMVSYENKEGEVYWFCSQNQMGNWFSNPARGTQYTDLDSCGMAIENAKTRPNWRKTRVYRLVYQIVSVIQ